jgi:nucleoside-diphosphate-sugar epimerase
MALYWIGPPEQITVSGRSFGTLPQGLTDHLDIMLQGERATAHVVISSVIKPQYYVNVFCEKGVVSINFDTSTVIINQDSFLPRTLDRGTTNFRTAYRLSLEGVKNTIAFLRGKLVPYQGLQVLLPRYYQSIRDSAQPPVPAALTVAVVKAEESIFAQLNRLHIDTRPRPCQQTGVSHNEKVLLTGATGYVGSAVVTALVKEGYAVRALVRPLAQTESLERLGVELFYGDLREPNTLAKATENIDIIVHLAAGVRGTSNFMLESCIDGTKHLAEAARSSGVKRVIYMSSMSVYDYAKLQDGDVINEETFLEEYPERRGTYSLAKRRAEDLALHHLAGNSPSWSILRPSVIIGKGNNVYSPAGVKIGNLLICLSSAHKKLRLVHVEDVAAAVIELIKNDSTRNRVYVLSSQDSLPLGEYIEKILRPGFAPKIRPIYIPYWVALLGSWTGKVLHRLTGKGPVISSQTLAYLYRDVHANSSAIHDHTGWRPLDHLEERLLREAKDAVITKPKCASSPYFG